ncbi:MAG TPA: hypothetical protein VFV86_06370 [Nitrososphaeraceae archaeon]|nr:hypothetical protein [Nitrososphaeraceae archaeon]
MLISENTKEEQTRMETPFHPTVKGTFLPTITSLIEKGISCRGYLHFPFSNTCLLV